jgi:hypothetical protein
VKRQACGRECGRLQGSSRVLASALADASACAN